MDSALGAISESMTQPLIIAEVGQAHDGSLGILHSFIDLAADCGASAVKFQTHIAEAESSDAEPFRTKFSYVDRTRFDYWRRMEFTAEQWSGIKQHCDERKVEFMSTPFSCRAVALLETLGVQRYKVGSGDVSNLLLLERIARTGKPVILSSGMSSWQELDDSVAFLRQRSIQFALLQCTSRYPTAAHEIGLNILGEMIERYACRVGLSDHSGEIYPALAAVTLGATIIEAHLTFDKRMFGPDSSASLTGSQFADLVRGIHFLANALNHPQTKDASDMGAMRTMFGRSLAASRDIPAGADIDIDMLECKKPAGHGIPASDYGAVVGRRLRHGKKRYEFIAAEDFE